MGKVKTRLLGLEEIEEKQKKEQKEKAAKKKAAKKKDFVIANSSVTPGKTIIQDEKIFNQVKNDKETKKTSPVKNLTVKVKSRGKRYEEAKKLIDKSKTYSIKDAVSILKKMKSSKIDESVELHLVVTEIGLKGEVELPHSIGKTVRVAVVDDKILQEIEKGKLNFDILVTHPSYMIKLTKYAKVLGPRGLMPNPKSGTISPHPEEVIKKFQRGVLRWKTEPKAPLIHQMIGKVSYEEKNLIENAEKFLISVGSKNIQKAYIKSTMSPSIKLSL